MAEHPRLARHVGVLHSAGILRARTSPSHGENRGSSPLGSANDFSSLAPKRSPGLAGISNFSPMDGCFRRSVRGHAVIVGSRRPEAICVTAEPASVLKMPTLRIAALPRGAN